MEAVLNVVQTVNRRICSGFNTILFTPDPPPCPFIVFLATTRERFIRGCSFLSALSALCGETQGPLMNSHHTDSVNVYSAA